jgi:hypothetical protein
MDGAICHKSERARVRFHCSGVVNPLGSLSSENIQSVFIKCALKFIVSAWNYLSKFAILFLYTKKPLIHGPLK